MTIKNQNNFRFPVSSRINSLALVTLLALMVSLLTASFASAGAIGNVGLRWRLAAKESALVNPEDHATMMGAMWDVPAQRRAERNMPWVEVENIPESTAALTEFRMTIGDERFNFSDELFANFTVISAGSDFNNVTTSATPDRNELVVMFNGDGLAPGQKIRFRIDIGIDDDQPELMNIWPHPDYRTVLFDMNGIDAWGPFPMQPMPPNEDDNSMARGTFSMNGMTAMVGPTAFPDATVVGPQASIFNQFFRPYHVMEDVDVFDAVDVGNPIPEPSTSLLAMFGMLAVGLVAQRRTEAVRNHYATATVRYCRKNAPRPQRQTSCRHRQTHNAAR